MDIEEAKSASSLVPNVLINVVTNDISDILSRVGGTWTFISSLVFIFSSMTLMHTMLKDQSKIIKSRSIEAGETKYRDVSETEIVR